MPSTGQHQVPQKQPRQVDQQLPSETPLLLISISADNIIICRARHAHEPNSPPWSNGYVQNASHEASHPDPSKNAAGPTQAGRGPEDTNGLALAAAASFSKELQITYLLCPSHGLFYHGSPDPRLQLGPSPMERYLEEGSAAQHALFVRADTGKLSTLRDCTCRARIEAEYGRQDRK